MERDWTRRREMSNHGPKSVSKSVAKGSTGSADSFAGKRGIVSLTPAPTAKEDCSCLTSNPYCGQGAARL